MRVDVVTCQATKWNDTYSRGPGLVPRYHGIRHLKITLF